MKINEFLKKLERERITGLAKDILIKQYIAIFK
jgi:hypothetical protein